MPSSDHTPLDSPPPTPSPWPRPYTPCAPSRPHLAILPVQLRQLPAFLPGSGTSFGRRPQTCRSEPLHDGLDGCVAEGEDPGARGGEDDDGHLLAAQDGKLPRLLEQAGAALAEADLGHLLALYAADPGPSAAHACATTCHCLVS